MNNDTISQAQGAPDLDLDKLEALARAADQGDGQHIYIHWRDSNNHAANLAWHNAASPAAFLALIELARRATAPNAAPADVSRAHLLLEQKWDAEGACTSCGWHAALYEHGVDDDDIADALLNGGILTLACISKDDETCDSHRGTSINLAAQPAAVPASPNYERMFMAACGDLGLISEELGLDPDDGGADPIIEAIQELKAQLATPPVAVGEAEQQLIQPAPVERDVNGYWSHPGVPEFDEGSVSEAAAWTTAQGLELTSVHLESESDDHPAYIAYFDKEEGTCAAWEPPRPSGEGWFILSIYDTEDGPICWWARRVVSDVAKVAPQPVGDSVPRIKGKTAAGWYVAYCEVSAKLKQAYGCIERYAAKLAEAEKLAPQPVGALVAKAEPYGWLQYIDGVKTQNFARTIEELEDIKRVFRLMKHTGKAEYVPVYAAPTESAAAPAPAEQHEARRWCKGDAEWTDWRAISAEDYARYKNDTTFEIRALATPTTQQGGDHG